MDESDLETAADHLSAEKGDVLELILYTTDFECTVQDNSQWQIHLDLSQSQLILPH